MTDQPRTAVEPITKAGQALWDRLAEPEDYEWGNSIRDAILAVEAEAADTAVSETAMEAVRQHRAEAAPLDVERLERAMLRVAQETRRDRIIGFEAAAYLTAREYARLASADKEGD